MVVSALAMVLSVAIPCTPVSPYPLSATVEPAQPTDADLVSITLSGRWGTPLVPDQARYERVGDTIRIDAGGASFESAPAVVTPWALTTQLGALPAGTYQVFGSVYAWALTSPTSPYDVLARGPDPVLTFTVTPEPGTMLLLTLGGAWAVRRREEKVSG